VHGATSTFVLNRIAMQEAYREEIARAFPGMVRAVVPLFETEVRGVSMLERMARILFVSVDAAAEPAPRGVQRDRRHDRVCGASASAGVADHPGDGDA